MPNPNNRLTTPPTSFHLRSAMNTKKNTPDKCCTTDVVDVNTKNEKPINAGVTTSWRIAEMDCPTEAQLIQNKLSAMPAVIAVNFNLLQRELHVTHHGSADTNIAEAIQSLGMHAEKLSETKPKTTEARAPSQWALIGAGLLAVGAELLQWADAPAWAGALAAFVAIVLCGTSTYRKGWVALKNRTLNINALMSIAVTGAVLIGQWPEAAMVMFLFTIAELIEARSLDRARHAISGLLQLTPEIATVQQQDGSWHDVQANTIAVDALVRVKPGERIALDGVIISGQSSVNQAPITGESLPVEKQMGDSVFAGTINESGSFEFRVTAPATQSTLARIIHTIENAQNSRAPTQRFVDRFAAIYTPTVFVIALSLAVLPPLLQFSTWFDAVYKALVLLVIACPCALVISTPVTIVSGLAAAARQGILIKGGVYLELGHRLQNLALDKTGTITQGKPQVTDVIPIKIDDQAHYLSIAISLANRSDHPVSRAIAQWGADNAVAVMDVTTFSALPGRGVAGTITNQHYQLGNHRLVHEAGLCSAQLESQLEQLERQGKTVILLISANAVLLIIAVADTIKASSKKALAALHALNIKTTMLTGDNQHTADAIAAQVGIDTAYGDQLPDQKLKAIESLAQRGVVGMVGDGINDAPALARADIGFAMGAAGTDAAIETADVALMDDDLGKIARFVNLSRTTHHVLRQNIVLALGIKFVFLLLTLLGFGSMWMAVFADMGASLLVVANGLRLLRS